MLVTSNLFPWIYSSGSKLIFLVRLLRKFKKLWIKYLGTYVCSHGCFQRQMCLIKIKTFLMIFFLKAAIKGKESRKGSEIYTIIKSHGEQIFIHIISNTYDLFFFIQFLILLSMFFCSFSLFLIWLYKSIFTRW